MGIEICHARFLLSAKRRGVRFRRIVMIGRQKMLVHAGHLRGLLSEFGFVLAADPMRELEESCDNRGYAEAFFRVLGAEEILSLDASDYEQATVIHDMNTPIPANLRSRFDAVFDGGSLEHIFNFPVAIRNCMEMAAIGGHCLTVNPTNNFPGHGFYQFSPELYYGVFSQANGFEVERAMISEIEGDLPWYAVPDPKQVRSRVEFVNGRPTHLMIQAKKLAELEGPWRFPQQSDYVAVWQGETAFAVTPYGFVQHSSLRKKLAALAVSLPGGKSLRQLVRRRNAQKTFLASIFDGPQGPFVKECEKR